MTAARANVLAAFLLALVIIFGAPSSIAKAAEPDSSAQNAEHKKSVAHGANGGGGASHPGGDADAGGKHHHPYAKRGHCNPRCGPTELPFAIEKRPPPRAAKKPRQAKATLPKDWSPSIDNCKYVRQDDHDSAGHSLWEAEKVACNKAGYPTPWSDKENSRSTPAPPDDTPWPERVRRMIDVKGHIQSEYDKAHGAQSTPCPSDTSLAQDAASGCQE